MKFIQCKSCLHFNPIKSEYQIFCDACGKKNPDNFKAWQQKNPDKNFEDFKNIIGTVATQPKKAKKKITPKQFLQRLALGLIFSVLIFFGNKYSSKVNLFFHDLAFPISELLSKEWDRQYFWKKQVSFESPYLLKELKIDDQLPKEVRDLIVKMDNYIYKESDIFSVTLSLVTYNEFIGTANLKGASNGSINELLQKMNGTDLYFSDTDTFVNQYSSIIKKGNFISDGNTINFKSISCIKSNLTIVQLLTLWVGEDENYILLSDRIINSLDMR